MKLFGPLCSATQHDSFFPYALCKREHDGASLRLEDDENSRSSRERRRYTDQIEHLEQQLEDLRLEYEVANTELQRLCLQRQQGEAAQREGIVAKLTDQVDKLRGDTIIQRIKIDELRGQRSHYVRSYKSYGPP